MSKKDKLISVEHLKWNVGGIRCGTLTVDYLNWILDHEEPAVDAVPVKHGKWIDETFEPWGLVHHPFKCNLCGEHAEFASPYCPNCGADMRGEE